MLGRVVPVAGRARTARTPERRERRRARARSPRRWSSQPSPKAGAARTEEPPSPEPAGRRRHAAGTGPRARARGSLPPRVVDAARVPADRVRDDAARSRRPLAVSTGPARAPSRHRAADRSSQESAVEPRACDPGPGRPPLRLTRLVLHPVLYWYVTRTTRTPEDIGFLLAKASQRFNRLLMERFATRRLR